MNELFIVTAVEDNGDLVIKASPQLLDIVAQGKGRVNVHVTPYEGVTSRQFVKWYKGILLPYLAEASTRLLGEPLTRDEVDLVNKQHAAGLGFKTVIHGHKTIIVFEDLHISQMSRLKKNNFMQRVTQYWAEKGIVIPEWEPETKRDFNNLT